MAAALMIAVFIELAVLGCLIFPAIIVYFLVPIYHSVRKTPRDKRLRGAPRFLIFFWMGFSIFVVLIWFFLVEMAKSSVPASLEQAYELMILPDEAQVTLVMNCGWAGDYYIEFRLPDTKQRKQWLRHVWELNSSLKDDFHDYEYREEANRIGIYCFGSAHMSIEYDPGAGVYRFRHYFES